MKGIGIMELDKKRARLVMISKQLRHHAMDEDQNKRSETIRESARHLAAQIIELCPSREYEREAALTRLRECMMWANAAISTNKPNKD
jgi:hypothetical protein